jgi:hypothetical protein
MPAKAGIQDFKKLNQKLDSGLRRNDGPFPSIRHSLSRGRVGGIPHIFPRQKNSAKRYFWGDCRKILQEMSRKKWRDFPGRNPHPRK